MLSKSEQKFLQENEDMLQKPKWKVILIYGMSWAVLMIISTTVVDYFVNGRVPPVRSIWFRILFFPLGGLAYGWLYRWFIIRRCRKIQAKQAAL